MELGAGMSGNLSKKLRELDAFLLSDAVGDNAMMLSGLDGFLAGVVVCPDLIMPSEWMGLIWGEEEGPVYDNLEQAQSINELIMGHYNDIIGQLDRGRYSPIFDIDTRNDDIVWELWLEGFWAALTLRPDAWLAFEDGSDAHKALSIVTRLHEIATTPASDLSPMDMDEELEKLAPDLIPINVEVLHKARLAQALPFSSPANQNTQKVGRNDPCPCGSGKKFKKCCLN